MTTSDVPAYLKKNSKPLVESSWTKQSQKAHTPYLEDRQMKDVENVSKQKYKFFYPK